MKKNRQRSGLRTLMVAASLLPVGCMAEMDARDDGADEQSGQPARGSDEEIMPSDDSSPLESVAPAALSAAGRVWQLLELADYDSDNAVQ